MEKYRLEFRSIYNHPNLIVLLSSAMASMSTWLSDYFETKIRAGIVFRSGNTIQVGWMILILREDEIGDLEVWEPGFNKMPIEWVEGASNTLRFLSIQKEVCNRAGVEPDYPSLRQSGVVSLDFLSSSSGFDMVRDQPDGTDSGWIFQRHGVESHKGKHCSLFEIAVSHPSIIPFLALPPSSSVRRSASGVKIESGSRFTSSETDNFLDRIRMSSAFS